jgi:hypothetical protein
MSEVYNPAQERSWYNGMEDGIGGCEVTVSDAEVCTIDDRFSSYKRTISLEEYLNETEEPSKVTYRKMVQQCMKPEDAAEIEQEIRRRVANSARQFRSS